MLAVIELHGPTGAGKTTIANLLAEELAPANILLVDASPDRKLTTLLAPTPPSLTVSDLLESAQTASTHREAIDWAFSDLTVPAGADQDVLTVGALGDTLMPLAQERLSYGFKRLIATYDYVIVDGYHPRIHALLPEEFLRALLVLKPEHLEAYLPSEEDAALATPALLLNQATQGSLPPVLEQVLLQGRVQLIGRLPTYDDADRDAERLSANFRNCLLRLNIPLHLQ